MNYRGSLGAGTDSVESIMGNIGDTDVKDCHEALKRCLGIVVDCQYYVLIVLINFGAIAL